MRYTNYLKSCFDFFCGRCVRGAPSESSIASKQRFRSFVDGPATLIAGLGVNVAGVSPSSNRSPNVCDGEGLLYELGGVVGPSDHPVDTGVAGRWCPRATSRMGCGLVELEVPMLLDPSAGARFACPPD